MFLWFYTTFTTLLLDICIIGVIILTYVNLIQKSIIFYICLLLFLILVLSFNISNYLPIAFLVNGKQNMDLFLYSFLSICVNVSCCVLKNILYACRNYYSVLHNHHENNKKYLNYNIFIWFMRNRNTISTHTLFKRLTIDRIFFWIRYFGNYALTEVSVKLRFW